MKQCLRCSSPLTGASAFCESCLTSLLSRSLEKEKTSYPDPPFRQVDASLLHGPALPVARNAFPKGSRTSRVRKILVPLVILAGLGLIFHGILGLTGFVYTHKEDNWTSGSPLLLLSKSIVKRGDNLTVSLSHYQPSSQVFLTRDVHEPIPLNATSSLVQVNAKGEATVQIPINESWKVGEHRITAEDIKTHYTINAPFYVIGTPGVRATATSGTTTAAGGTATMANTSSSSASEVNLNVSPSSLTFITTTVQGSSSGQNVTIADNGNNAFSWKGSVDASASSWLKTTPEQGSVSAGQTGQMTVSSNATGLNTGTYTAHITIISTDASGTQIGSARTISVAMNVLTPCSLQVAPGKLDFSASLLNPSPRGQSITLKSAGGCSYPVSWTVSVDDGGKGWLSATPTYGGDNGSGDTVTVNVAAKGLLLGSYKGQITISAVDNNGVAMQNGPQKIPVTLTVVG